MNISALFIRRPIMTTLVMAAILIFGLLAYRLLPVSDLPQIDFPTIQVNASLPGASPDTMAASIATPLEKQFTTIAGLDSMTSGSAQGSTQITLQFNLSRNIDAAAQDVQAAISRAAAQLPPQMPSPPSFQKVNPADQPILYLALTSPTLPLYSLDEYGQTMMAQRISMVAGVAQVLVYGSQKYAVRVQVNPQALASRGIGIDEVATAIQNANVELPTGTLYGPHRTVTVEATGQLTTAPQYRPVIIAYRNGNPVRLNQIGRAVDSVENDKTAAWFIKDRSVILAIQRQPGTNTVEVVDGIRKLLPQFQGLLPASVSLNVLYDRSQSIRDSVQDVEFSLLLALSLVVVVIFLFLRNVRATIIPSLAIPMSIIGTFAVMYILGFSVDNLSLMALTLSIGFVVDDAIVMLENSVRHMELGAGPMEATLLASREIGFTIISMTLSLVAVFIPVLFMPGILGRLLNEFAMTIGLAILISGVVSLSLTPMLCSRFLRPPESVHHGRVYAASERVFNGMLWLYEVSLRWVLRHRLTTLFVSGVVLAGTIYLFLAMPKGFLPSEDTGQIIAFTEAVQGVGFADLLAKQQAAAEIVADDPNVDLFMSSAGSRGATGANQGILFIRLKPRPPRKLNPDQIIQELRPKLAQVTGLNTYMQNPPPIRIGGQLTKSQYQFTLQSPDTQELYRLAPQFEQKVRQLPGFLDVTSDLQIKNPQVTVEINRDRASTLNVSAQQIELALSSAYGTRQISTIYTPSNTYQVILQLEPEFQTDPTDLPLLYIRSSTGQLVPLSAVARLAPNLGPLTVNHTGQLPSVTISFNLPPGYPLGNAVQSVQDLARTTLPATFSTSFQGTAQVFQSSLAGLTMLLVVAILVIYLVLGILYESFIHPITILTALPFAGFGALVTLLIFGYELNLYAFVGIIMLIGLVKKNGIMMIDFAIEAQRTEDKPPAEAIFEACMVRFRPIMMTTVAALVGTLPIALGFGAGADARRPLGLAVVGGLLFSQLLTLYVTPVFYLYLERLRTRFQAPAPEPAPELAPMEQPVAK